ncbi:sigma-70 factor domain-containing protein [Sphaerimonospora sp. CA-214678]|uniref:sigma-70 factor domain-containing protein n=1 Tax=Sphaerimonospora sp. CA-214678 TaxID=3240029 RepID=UPI003D91D78D
MTTAARHPKGVIDIDSVQDHRPRIGRTPLLTAEQEVEPGRRIEAGRLAGSVSPSGCDGPSERRELERPAADGRDARDHMVEADLRPVVSIARRYAAACTAWPYRRRPTPWTRSAGPSG